MHDFDALRELLNSTIDEIDKLRDNDDLIEFPEFDDLATLRNSISDSMRALNI